MRYILGNWDHTFSDGVQHSLEVCFNTEGELLGARYADSLKPLRRIGFEDVADSLYDNMGELSVEEMCAELNGVVVGKLPDWA